MTVMITGGMGVIGSWCTRRLVEQGIRVVTFDKAEDTSFLKDLSGNFDAVVGDVLDFPHLIHTLKHYKIDRIIHMAGLATPPLEVKPYYHYRVNVDGSLNVFEAARLMDVTRVVAMSSRSVYDVAKGEFGYPTYKPISEEYPKEPRRVYGATKLFMENMGLNYHRIYGLDFVALRCASTYGPGKLRRRAVQGMQGPGSHATYSEIIESAVLGRSFSLAQGGDQIDDIVYHKDIAQGVVCACVVEKTEDRIFNIGTGRGVTLNQLVVVLNKILGKVPISIGPGFGLPGQSPSVLDIKKACRQLDYRPEYDLEAGVRDYITEIGSLDSYVQPI